MLTPRGEMCANCRFWFSHDHRNGYAIDEREGYCRRYPPTVVSDIEDGLDYVRPITVGGFWCGEWRLAEYAMNTTKSDA